MSIYYISTVHTVLRHIKNYQERTGIGLSAVKSGNHSIGNIKIQFLRQI